MASRPNRKLDLQLVGFASQELEEAHRAYCKQLGLPGLGSAGSPNLAFVGGGPSVEDHIQELWDWDGDIWAVNGAHKWLRRQGIDSWFFTVDPSQFVINDAEFATRAILATTCHPKLFDVFHGKRVETFNAQYGPTSACEAAFAAIERGYKTVTYFGCEGSYPDHHKRHAYDEKRLAETVIEITVDGETFYTQGDFIRQAETLAGFIRHAPNVFAERSGGLLRALIKNPDYDLVQFISG